MSEARFTTQSTAQSLRELAGEIEQAGPEEQGRLLREAWRLVHGEWPDAGDWHQGHATRRFARMIDAAAYESAAMSLVPSGAGFLLAASSTDAKADVCTTTLGDPNAEWFPGGRAATPALALCAAALRARAASAIEARRAETPESGSVHESAVGESRDAQIRGDHP